MKTATILLTVILPTSLFWSCKSQPGSTVNAKLSPEPETTFAEDEENSQRNRELFLNQYERFKEVSATMTEGDAISLGQYFLNRQPESDDDPFTCLTKRSNGTDKEMMSANFKRDRNIAANKSSNDISIIGSRKGYDRPAALRIGGAYDSRQQFESGYPLEMHGVFSASNLIDPKSASPDVLGVKVLIASPDKKDILMAIYAADELAEPIAVCY